jgi:hypothetical protein
LADSRDEGRDPVAVGIHLTGNQHDVATVLAALTELGNCTLSAAHIHHTRTGRVRAYARIEAQRNRTDTGEARHVSTSVALRAHGSMTEVRGATL